MKSLLELKCPSCNSVLDYEEGMTVMYCKYCGNKIMINDSNAYTFKSIDLAEIEKTKVEAERLKIQERMINREYDRNEKENKKYNRNTIIFMGIIAFLVIQMMSSFNSDSINGFIILDVVLLLVAGMMIRYDDHKKKERMNYKNLMKAQGINVIELNQEALNYEGRNYNYVYNQFQNLGFKNIKLMPMGDIFLISFFSDGRVESVTINNEPPSDGIYREDDQVVIKYHSR